MYVQHTGKHSTVCLSPKQLSTRRLLWKALPLGSRPGPEQMFAQTTQYNILYNIYDVFGTNTILVQIEIYTAFQYQETDAHYL